MSNIEIPVSSAVINLINIVILQLILTPIVTRTTSLLAGFDNHARQKKGGHVILQAVDIPVVGESLIMGKGLQRRLLIALRVSVLIAIGVSNVGLEGRSRPKMIVQPGEVFGPGRISENERNKTLLQERLTQHLICNIVVDDGRTHRFGSVVDGQCFREMEDFAYIKYLKSDIREFDVAIEDCSSETRESRTIRKCKNVEFVCNEDDSKEACIALRFVGDGKTAWQCEKASIVNESRAKLSDCRSLMTAEGRGSLQWWSDAVVRFQLKGTLGVFASAYAVPRQENVEVEDGEEEVTIVTLLWLIPFGWVVLVMLISIVWIIWQKRDNGRAVSHDERTLFGLLDSRLVVTDGNECLVTYRDDEDDEDDVAHKSIADE